MLFRAITYKGVVMSYDLLEKNKILFKSSPGWSPERRLLDKFMENKVISKENICEGVKKTNYKILIERMELKGFDGNFLPLQPSNLCCLSMHLGSAADISYDGRETVCPYCEILSPKNIKTSEFFETYTCQFSSVSKSLYRSLEPNRERIVDEINKGFF
jgi:hypothetical protein